MVLFGGQLAVCSIFTIYLGGAGVTVTPTPFGECKRCCPVDTEKQIRYYLYTRSNPYKPDNLFLDDVDLLQASNIDFSKPIIVYLHGFSEQTQMGSNESSRKMRDAFLRSGDNNVILLDWSYYTAAPWYSRSVRNTFIVARHLASFIKFLVSNGANIKSFHLLGFSIGSHAIGNAGKILLESGLRIPRITGSSFRCFISDMDFTISASADAKGVWSSNGEAPYDTNDKTIRADNKELGLDPALPLFEFLPRSKLLNADDAEFVDIIHSDGGIFGILPPLGHADFYPNGGFPVQPGCIDKNSLTPNGVGNLVACSHQRAWRYFAESLDRPRAFKAVECWPSESMNGTLDGEQCAKQIPAYMGIGANKRLRGKFYLTTASSSPFGKS